MAANIFTGSVDSNWGTAGNWSLSRVPTATDGDVATFDATSPNCTVNSSNRVCNALDFTGYTNTITMTFNITVSGNVTLSSGMGIAGSSTLAINATASLTSNGRTWPNDLTLLGVITATLADDWEVSGTTTSNSTLTLNGTGRVLKTASYTHSPATVAVSGTATIVMNGTGTLQTLGTGSINLNIVINTSGTVTITGASGNFRVNGNGIRFTYTAGTIVPPTQLIVGQSNYEFDCNGMTWSNFLWANNTTRTLTLVSPMTITGNMSFSVSNATLTMDGSTLTIGGNITMNSLSSGFVQGTTKFIMNGTNPNFSMTSAVNGSFRCDLEVAVTGNLTLVGTAVSGTNGGFRYFSQPSRPTTLKLTSGNIIAQHPLNLARSASADMTIECNSSGFTIEGETYIRNSAPSILVKGTQSLNIENLVLNQINNTASANIIIESGYTLNILNSQSYVLLSNVYSENRFTFESDTTGQKAKINLSHGATQDFDKVNFTDIEATQQTLWTYKGIVTDSVNVFPLTIPKTISSIFL